MILVQKQVMPADNLDELKVMSRDLAQTIKNREAMVGESDDASRPIHKQKLARYQQQKAEVDSKISSLTKTTLTK